MESEVDVGAISVECLSIKSEGVGQIFLVNDDGTISSDSQLHCIESEASEMMEAQQFPIYDIDGQQFILDGNGHMQLLQNSTDGSVVFTESGETQFQELCQTEDLKYAVDENMDLGLAAENSSSEPVTQITLDEEQCRQLEQHGRILLQQDDRHYLLDQWGLHDVTGDIETVDGFHNAIKILSEDNMMLANASHADDSLQYEGMDVEMVNSVIPITDKTRHLPYPDHIDAIEVTDSKMNIADLVAKQGMSKTVDYQSNLISAEGPLPSSLTMYESNQVILVPKSEAVKPQTLMAMKKGNSNVVTNSTNQESSRMTKDSTDSNGFDESTEYFVTVTDMPNSEDSCSSAMDSVFLEMPKPMSKAPVRIKTSSKSLLQSSVLQNSKTAKEDANAEAKLINASQEKGESIDCSLLPPIMQKYLQANNGKKAWRGTNSLKVEEAKKTIVTRIRQVQKARTRNTSLVESTPSRFIASESLQSSKKEVQLFTSQYGISWRDDTNSLKLKLTSKLPPGICDLKNKKIPIGPTKTGKRLIGKILSVVRPQSAPHCRKAVLGSKSDEKTINGRLELSDDAALESLIKSVLQSSDKDCTGEDLASTEKILEGLMRVESVNDILGDRDVAVIKVLLEKKDNRIVFRDVKSVVCGRMGMFSDPTTDRLAWKFMYMPDLIKRRNCTDLEGVEEFEVTADGVPYRRNHVRSGDGDSTTMKRPSDRPLLQVRILETIDEREVKHSKIVIVETLPGNKQNKIASSTTSIQSTPKPIIREDDVGRKYQCSICLKVFGSMMLYTKHLSTDHRIKWVSCCYCNKMFNRPSNLQRHLRIHSDVSRGATPVNEDACDSRDASVESPLSADDAADDSTSANASANGNVKSGKKRNIYKCELCSCSYYYSSTLTRHIINSHILASGKPEDTSSVGKDSRIPCSCTVLPHPHADDDSYHGSDNKN